MDAKPYVGVTGIVNPTEADAVANAFKKAGFSMKTKHIPMMGYLAHYKTLHGIPPKKGKVPNLRYPNQSMLEPLMEKSKDRALNMVHYATPETEDLPHQIKKLFRGLYEKGLCRAVQLNIPWPEPAHLEEILESFPEMQIVMQLSGQMMNNCSTNEIIENLQNHKDHIDYLLIDPSGGTKQEFNTMISVMMYKRIKEVFPSITLGFAGGLDGKNVEDKIKGVKRELGNTSFCIDAEGGLRTKRGRAEYLDIDKVREYLLNAASALNTPE